MLKERKFFIKCLWLFSIPAVYSNIEYILDHELERIFDVKSPSKIDLLFLLGGLQIKSCRVDYALSLFEKCKKLVLEIYGSNSYCYAKICLYLAECYYISHKEKEARAHYFSSYILLLLYEATKKG